MKKPRPNRERSLSRATPKPMTSRDFLMTAHEAELFARIEWLRRAHQAEFMRLLDGRSEEEQQRIHALIRGAKAEVARKWGDPRVLSGEATIRALYEAKGPHACVMLWSDLDGVMFERFHRMKVQRIKRENGDVN